MGLSLCVGSTEFWTHAAEDIARARRRVLVEAMTFEGDAAGLMVADVLSTAGAPDRRLLIDSYTRYVVNDRFVIGRAKRDPVQRAEIEATRAMVARLGASGMAVRWTNPIGWNPVRYGVRNHKKLIVADDVAYIGGFNFSDHNFSWADLMLRIDDAGAADFFAADFAATWAGRPRTAVTDLPGLRLSALDGAHNEAGFAPLFEAIERAERTITVVSAYPTKPFTTALAAAAARGIAVEVLTPLPNNKPIVRDALLGDRAMRGLDVRLLADMTHIKAMLIDGRTLVLGSSNFDFASYWVEEEYLAIATDPALVANFVTRVLTSLRANTLDPADHRPRLRTYLKMRAYLGIATAAMRSLQRTRRTAIERG